MKCHDFVLFVSGEKAVLSTHRWTATQWLRERAPRLLGSVVGAKYATVTGSAEALTRIATQMETAGLTRPAPTRGKGREGTV